MNATHARPASSPVARRAAASVAIAAVAAGAVAFYISHKNPSDSVSAALSSSRVPAAAVSSTTVAPNTSIPQSYLTQAPTNPDSTTVLTGDSTTVPVRTAVRPPAAAATPVAKPTKIVVTNPAAKSAPVAKPAPVAKTTTTPAAKTTPTSSAAPKSSAPAAPVSSAPLAPAQITSFYTVTGPNCPEGSTSGMSQVIVGWTSINATTAYVLQTYNGANVDPQAGGGEGVKVNGEWLFPFNCSQEFQFYELGVYNTTAPQFQNMEIQKNP
jgi:hypothetical protein